MRVRVVPGARRDEISGWHGGAVKVRCRAPALDGRANEAVRDLIAEKIGVNRSAVSITHGLRSRDKIVAIEGIAAGEAYARLGLLAPPVL